MRNPLALALCFGVLFPVLMVNKASATEKVRFFVKTGEKSPEAVAEVLPSISLANCKAYRALPFDQDEVVAGLECNDQKDIFVALAEIAAKLEGIEGITLAGVKDD